jgi:hypothetical protein
MAGILSKVHLPRFNWILIILSGTSHPVEPKLELSRRFLDTAIPSTRPQAVAAAIQCPISSMPVTRKITGPRGSEFWASLDLEDSQLLQTIVKKEVRQGVVFAQSTRSVNSDVLSAQFKRLEPADEIHYVSSYDIPPDALNMNVSLPCFRDCLVFLYRGAISTQGEVLLNETGHAYAVKNEEWLGLDKNTTIFVMEQGAMKGICNRKTDEEQRANQTRKEAWEARLTLAQSEDRARREALEAKRNTPWNKLLRKLRREPEPEAVQCATQ